MSTFKVQKVEFEPPIKGAQRSKPFTGWLCVALSDLGFWYAGADEDSANDAYSDVERQAEEGNDSVLIHTVQMFRVDPA